MLCVPKRTNKWKHHNRKPSTGGQQEKREMAINWTEYLTSEIEDTYGATFGLLKLVDDSDLNWKPATGDNWMTTGQLLRHIAEACGFCCRGFVTGDWGMPPAEGSDGADGAETKPDAAPENMLPPAESMATVTSVAEAVAMLEADKAVALAMVAEAGEESLTNTPAPAPWDPSDKKLGPRLHSMVDHLASHKAQLFYYLKLQGKPVNTWTLWGG